MTIRLTVIETVGDYHRMLTCLVRQMVSVTARRVRRPDGLRKRCADGQPNIRRWLPHGAPGQRLDGLDDGMGTAPARIGRVGVGGLPAPARRSMTK